MAGGVRGFRRAGAAIFVAGAALMMQQASHAEVSAQPAASASVATPAVSREEAEGIIFERQQIMLQLEKDTEGLGEIAAGLRPADKLAVTARAIADGARDSAAAFEQNVPGGRAKPEVWANWQDYSQRMQLFVQKSEEMAKHAEAGNLTRVTEVMADALPCKQCHDVYREKKK